MKRSIYAIATEPKAERSNSFCTIFYKWWEASTLSLQSNKPNDCSRPILFLNLCMWWEASTLSLRWQKPNKFVLAKPIPKEKGYQCSPFPFGAGDENRTHNHSLGSCCFATKLHLHVRANSAHISLCCHTNSNVAYVSFICLIIIHKNFEKVQFYTFFRVCKLVFKRQLYKVFYHILITEDKY